MSGRREKLALALDLARQKLNENGAAIERVSHARPELKSKSKMNKLLGKHDVVDQREGSLLNRTTVVERPTFELVANGVLGRQRKPRTPALELHSNGESLADIAARRARRAGSDVPKAKEFCIYQYALFVSTHSQILFDSEHCGGKHPLWSEMESCEKTKCWDKQMKPILKDGGGCLALYYDLYFSMVCGHESAGAQRVPA